MAVREVHDDSRTVWRVWDITPDRIHPQTAAEDFLAECYQLGWLVFETKAGDRKRRLCPIPRKWQEQSDDFLRQLLAQADEVPPVRLAVERQPAAPRQVVAGDLTEVTDLTDLEVIRSFRYPGGRLWTVCVIEHPDAGGPPVLRFQAGLRSVDLVHWSRAWADARDDQLLDMLRHALPRVGPAVPGDVPRRRWDDALAE